MMLFFWVFLGLAALCIVLAAALKDFGLKILCVLGSLLLIGLVIMSTATLYRGNPMTFLPHGETFTTICSQQLNDNGVDYAILYLAEVRISDKSLGKSLKAPKFYKIETWRLRDKNKQQIYEIPFVFEVLVFTESVIDEDAEKSWQKVQQQTLYCLIPSKF